MTHDLPSQNFTSVFSRTFDAVVVGGGYAGIAAVTRLRAAGWSVLLLDRRVALLWECGWAFHGEVGTSDLPGFESRGGAVAEIEAAARARREGWDILGYTTPVGVAVDGDRLVDVALGAKSGLRRVRARRWLDATDDGELIRLLGATPAAPSTRSIAVHRVKQGDLRDQVNVTLGATERVAQGWLRGLTGREAAGWVVSHGSVVAYPTWTKTASLPTLPANVASAVPAFASGPLPTLADRYRLGWEAAGKLLAAPAAEPSAAPIAQVRAMVHQQIEVAVVGAGTGGALAALAAARAGAATLAIDPLPFSGGIGTGGGIHWYYHGVKGGLQDVLDARVREILPLFGSPKQVHGFHPDAKKCALDGLMAEAGVVHQTGTLVSVEREGRAIRSALIATPQGPLTVPAQAWIDGTGDGDLCAQAGCASRFGRAGDGLPHAFSQSSGRTHDAEGGRKMTVVNFDQGFVDATDVEDLCRARILGIAQYQQQDYTSAPTYIAPALGLRQSRHIATRTTLELSDLIERRRFPDSVGTTGCHYDNHATDYEFESDEAMFWVWACRAWHHRTACDIPFGILVPQDLDNTFIASRCLGVSQDAHHSLRMQRDMQRIGEVAGLAATQVARRGAVDLAILQTDLQASGALAEAGISAEETFGPAVPIAQFAQLEADLRSADYVKAGTAMWNAYRSGDRANLIPLTSDPDPLLSWRAATTLAIQGDAAALPRLWQAIERREYGFEDAAENLQPERFNRVVPAWRLAVSLLRCVGTAADLARLARTFVHETLHFSLANQLATTVARLAAREQPSAADAPVIAKLIDRCAGANGGAWRDPQQNHLHIAGLRGTPPAQQRAAVRDDASWQLAFAVARARQALGVAVTPPTSSDERAVVRRAWAQLAKPVAGKAAAMG